MPSNATYPTWVGFVFIFNLIVGTGALTLPAVFAKAGWLLSSVVLVLLAFISFMTATFIIEAMACANAVRSWQILQVEHVQKNEENDDDDDDNDSLEPLLPVVQFQPSQDMERPSVSNEDNAVQRSSLYYYKLDEKFELSEMAVLFFNDFGRIVFPLCIAIYLYGDLSIYSAAVSKSLSDIACDAKNTTTHIAWHKSDDDVDGKCWVNHSLTRIQVYRLFLIAFTVICGPFSAFSLQKTKYLQILTGIFRCLAFTFMIVIAVKLLLTQGPKGHPPLANIYGLPSLFGACVYSFMCHHSLPSLLAPIRDKFALRKIISYDFVVISAFYLLLAITGIFAFANLEDLYTLNFIPNSSASSDGFTATLLIVIDYFLALFPVFTLTASYPIIAISLRNNLQTLFLDMARFDSYNFFTRKLIFPLCAIIPPFVICFFTRNLTSLVAFTGSYAGAGIQYLIPVCLIYFARNTCSELLGRGITNEFQSPFRSTYWLGFVLIWAVACMCLVTINFFY